MTQRPMICMDGNEAAASVAHRINEVIAMWIGAEEVRIQRRILEAEEADGQRIGRRGRPHREHVAGGVGQPDQRSLGRLLQRARKDPGVALGE